VVWIVVGGMSPELWNLLVSLGVFAAVVYIFRYFFAASQWGGAGLQAASSTQHAAKPANYVEIHSEQQFNQLIKVDKH
jgi:hypothetical protein